MASVILTYPEEQSDRDKQACKMYINVNVSDLLAVTGFESNLTILLIFSTAPGLQKKFCAYRQRLF